MKEYFWKDLFEVAVYVVELNEKYFKLPEEKLPTIGWKYKGASLGMFYWSSTGDYRIAIKNNAPKAIVRHEMIHWYLCVVGNRCGHNKDFWAWSKKLRCGDSQYRERIEGKRKQYQWNQKRRAMTMSMN